MNITNPARLLPARMLPAGGWVRRRRPLLGLLPRLALVFSLAVAAYATIPVLVTLKTSYDRHVEHTRPVHSDGSKAVVRAERGLDADGIEIVLRDVDGDIRRVVAERAAADRFVNERLAYLREERARVKAEARRDLQRVFTLAFADSEAAIAAYADWFFEWKRSYLVLRQSVAATLSRLIEFGKYETLSVAVERDVRDYFLRHYREQVLKPEYRDPLIAGGFEDTAGAARASFQRVLANQDLALQLFLARNTRHSDLLDGDGLTDLRLDWDAQRWKAPTHLMEDRGFDALLGLTRAGAGGTLGAVVLGPAVEAAMARSFAALGSRFASGYAARLALVEGGAAAGTVIMPAGGMLAGAAIGVALGFGADYLLNASRERIDRPAFVAANENALAATVSAWQSLLAAGIDDAVDAWFDDAETAVMLAG